MSSEIIAGTRSQTERQEATSRAEGLDRDGNLLSVVELRDVEGEVVALYEENAVRLYRYGLSITADEALAQDAIQETFMRYFKERVRNRDIRDCRAWLFRVLRNYVLDRLKEANTRLTDVAAHRLEDMPDRSHDPEADYRHLEFWSQLEDLLSRRELECLRLRAEGLSYREIADVMEIRLGTVGVVLSRGIQKLRRLF